MRARAMAVLTVAAAALVTPSAANAAEVVIGDPLPATGAVDAYGTRVVLTTGTSGAYGLSEYAGTRVRPLPVGDRRVPFDVDLGPGPGGGVVAVYSRCEREPEKGSSQLDGTRGCDLYLFDFEKRVEIELTGANSTSDEYFPTVWKDRIAFVRVYKPRGVQTRWRLYTRSLTRRGSSRRLSVGRRGGLLRGLDMRGRGVLFVWSADFYEEVRLARAGARGRLISLLGGSGAAVTAFRAVGTSLVRGFAYWVVNQVGEPPNTSEVRRRAIEGGVEERATVFTDRMITSFAQNGLEGFELRSRSPCTLAVCPPPPPFDVWRVTGRTFGPAPPLEMR